MGRACFHRGRIWFAFWMILAAAIGGWMAEPGQPR